MTCIIDVESKPSPTAKFAICLAASTFLVFGTLVTPSNAEERGVHQGEEDNADRDHDQMDRRHVHVPTVIYGSPHCKAPPVVYGNDLLCPY